VQLGFFYHMQGLSLFSRLPRSSLYRMRVECGVGCVEWLSRNSPAKCQAHTHTHTHTHTHKHTHRHAHTYKPAYTHKCAHTHVHTHISTHTHTRTNLRTHTSAHTHTYTHIHTHTHIHKHTHTECHWCNPVPGHPSHHIHGQLHAPFLHSHCPFQGMCSSLDPW
jgi:hypothetical protein